VRSISPHLSSGQVADLLDRRLAAGDRDSVVAHLAACAECRREVAELYGVLSHVVLRRRPRWFAGAALAAAGVLAFIAIPRVASHYGEPAQNASATRNASPSLPQTPGRIGIVEPADGQTLSPTRAVSWRSVGADASYSLTVQDGAGAVLWTKATTDTAVVLPATVQLKSGEKYFWSVDALLSDGTSSRSGAHPFTAR